MTRILSSVDRISAALGAIAMALFVVLVGDMIYEVVSRRLFGAPTLWAYDISYMVNGVAFLLAAGVTLRANEHIRIDFLSTRLPRRMQDAVNAVVYVVLILPAFAIISYGAVDAALDALATGELEPSSPWKPLIWPFYAGIAIGMLALTLQAAAQLVRHVRAGLGGGKSPLAAKAKDG